MAERYQKWLIQRGGEVQEMIVPESQSKDVRSQINREGWVIKTSTYVDSPHYQKAYEHQVEKTEFGGQGTDVQREIHEAERQQQILEEIVTPKPAEPVQTPTVILSRPEGDIRLEGSLAKKIIEEYKEPSPEVERHEALRAKQIISGEIKPPTIMVTPAEQPTVTTTTVSTTTREPLITTVKTTEPLVTVTPTTPKIEMVSVTPTTGIAFKTDEIIITSPKIPPNLEETSKAIEDYAQRTGKNYITVTGAEDVGKVAGIGRELAGLSTKKGEIIIGENYLKNIQEEPQELLHHEVLHELFPQFPESKVEAIDRVTLKTIPSIKSPSDALYVSPVGSDVSGIIKGTPVSEGFYEAYQKALKTPTISPISSQVSLVSKKPEIQEMVTTTVTTTKPLMTTIKTDPKAFEKFAGRVQEEMMEKEQMKLREKVFPISTKVESIIDKTKISEVPILGKFVGGVGKEFFGSIATAIESPITLKETITGTIDIAKQQGVKQTMKDYGSAFSMMPEATIQYAYENPLEFGGRIAGGILLSKAIQKVTTPKYVESLELEKIYQEGDTALVKGKVISKAKPLIGKAKELGVTEFQTIVKTEPMEGLEGISKSKSFSQIISDIKGEKIPSIGKGVSVSSTKGKLTGSVGIMDVYDVKKTTGDVVDLVNYLRKEGVNIDVRLNSEYLKEKGAFGMIFHRKEIGGPADILIEVDLPKTKLGSIIEGVPTKKDVLRHEMLHYLYPEASEAEIHAYTSQGGLKNIPKIEFEKINTVASKSISQKLPKGKYFTIGESLTEEGTKGVSISFSQVISGKGGVSYGDIFTEIAEVAKQKTTPLITTPKVTPIISPPKTPTPKIEPTISEGKSPLTGFSIKVPEPTKIETPKGSTKTEAITQLEKYTPYPVSTKPVSIQVVKEPEIQIKFPDQTSKPESEKLKYPSPYSPPKKIIEEEEYYIRPPISPAIEIPSVGEAQPTEVSSIFDAMPSIQQPIGTEISQMTEIQPRDILYQQPIFTGEIISPITITQPSMIEEQRQQPSIGQIFMENPITKPVQIQKPIKQERQRFKTITIQKPSQKQKYRQITTQIQTPIKPVTIISPLSSKSKFRLFKLKGEMPKAYSVLVRKKGKFVKVKTPPLTRESALALGAKIIGETELASFKLEPTAGRPVSLGGRFKPFMFRRPKGKSRLGSDVYIEKSKFRIDQPIELREITYKGIQASKQKNKMKIPKLNFGKVKKVAL